MDFLSAIIGAGLEELLIHLVSPVIVGLKIAVPVILLLIAYLRSAGLPETEET